MEIWLQKMEKIIKMNEEKIELIIKALAEMDKKLIEEDTKYNLSKEQKEILKEFIDYCYDNLKKWKKEMDC